MTSAEEICAFNKSKGIHITQYSPFGNQNEIATQLFIPKSNTPSRIKTNLEGDLKLDPAGLKKIDAIDKKMRFNDSGKSFNYNFYTDIEGKRKQRIICIIKIVNG
jgi:alcohol dehydrogenase (NADP+)